VGEGVVKVLVVMVRRGVMMGLMEVVVVEQVIFIYFIVIFPW
jgi:hypothetical protein